MTDFTPYRDHTPPTGQEELIQTLAYFRNRTIELEKSVSQCTGLYLAEQQANRKALQEADYLRGRLIQTSKAATALLGDIGSRDDGHTLTLVRREYIEALEAELRANNGGDTK